MLDVHDNRGQRHRVFSELRRLNTLLMQKKTSKITFYSAVTVNNLYLEIDNSVELTL